MKKWRAKDLKPLGTYLKHSWPVNCIDSLPSSHKTFCSVSEGGEVILWRSNKSKRLNGPQGAVHSVKFAPRKEAPLFATGGADATIRLWNVVKEAGGKRVLAQWHNVDNSPVMTLAFANENSTLVSGSEDGALVGWNYEGAQLFVFAAHKQPLTALSLSPTEPGTLLSSSLDGTLKFWSLEAQEEAGEVRCRAEVQHATFGSNGSFIVTCEGERVRLWNKSSSGWKAVSTFNAHLDQVTQCFPCVGGFVSSSADSFIRLWEGPEQISFDETIADDDIEAEESSLEDEDSSDEDETDLFLNPNAKLKRRGSHKPKEATSVEVGSKDATQEEALQHEDWISHLAFAPNSTVLATAAKDNTIGSWEVGSAQCRGIVEFFGGELNCIAFSADSALLFAGGSSLVVYGSESLEPKHSIDLGKFVANSIVVSQDSKAVELVDFSGSTVCFDVEKEESVEDVEEVTWFYQDEKPLDCDGQHIKGPPSEEQFVGFTLDSAVNVQAVLSPNEEFAAVSEGRKLHILKLEGPST